MKAEQDFTKISPADDLFPWDLAHTFFNVIWFVIENSALGFSIDSDDNRVFQATEEIIDDELMSFVKQRAAPKDSANEAKEE